MKRKNFDMAEGVGIAFLGSSRSGLGHLRRIANIARHVSIRKPDLTITLVTNASPSGLPRDDLAWFSKIDICNRANMSAYLREAQVHLAVLDTLKLSEIGAYSGKTALILRETPQEHLNGFRRDDGRPWDVLIIPNPRNHWMPSVDECFAIRAEATGWILRDTGRRRPDERSAGIVLASGGGGTPETRRALYPMLERVVALARERCPQSFCVRQALGPRAGSEAVPGVDDIFDPKGDLNAVFRAADIVISTAGYNSVLELASTDTPAMIVPIPRSLDDQTARVRLWGPKLGFGLEPDNVERAADWLAEYASQPRRRPPLHLGPDGAVRAAEILLDMV